MDVAAGHRVAHAEQGVVLRGLSMARLRMAAQQSVVGDLPAIDRVADQIEVQFVVGHGPVLDDDAVVDLIDLRTGVGVDEHGGKAAVHRGLDADQLAVQRERDPVPPEGLQIGGVVHSADVRRERPLPE